MMTSNFDLQHSNAFGVHTGISSECRDDIDRIKDNSEHITSFELSTQDAAQFSQQAWELLGRYIANNTNLEQIKLNNCNLTDRKMALLFKELTNSESLKKLDIGGVSRYNEFGIEGVRCMVPFLQNSPNLSIFDLVSNDNFDSECFDLLIRSLQGATITDLNFHYCNIRDISVLESYNLPKLKILCLIGNKIGKEGCITISNLLQKEGTTLGCLILMSAGIDDEGAEMIASSLKNNTTLEVICLENNDGITGKGCKAFLKLVVDVSSTESTYKSNHKLRVCRLINIDEHENEIQTLITSVCKEKRSILRGRDYYSNKGRERVITYQLDSQNRKKLCHLQGIDYSPGNIFADIEPVLMPKVLSLIGDRHGQSELYTALIPTAPDLLSYIDRKAKLNDILTNNTAQIAALTQQLTCLTAQNADIHRRLELVELGDTKQLENEGGTDQSRVREGVPSCNKRQRS